MKGKPTSTDLTANSLTMKADLNPVDHVKPSGIKDPDGISSPSKEHKKVENKGDIHVKESNTVEIKSVSHLKSGLELSKKSHVQSHLKQDNPDTHKPAKSHLNCGNPATGFEATPIISELKRVQQNRTQSEANLLSEPSKEKNLETRNSFGTTIDKQSMGQVAFQSNPQHLNFKLVEEMQLRRVEPQNVNRDLQTRPANRPTVQSKHPINKFNHQMSVKELRSDSVDHNPLVGEISRGDSSGSFDRPNETNVSSISTSAQGTDLNVQPGRFQNQLTGQKENGRNNSVRPGMRFDETNRPSGELEGTERKFTKQISQGTFSNQQMSSTDLKLVKKTPSTENLDFPTQRKRTVENPPRPGMVRNGSTIKHFVSNPLACQSNTREGDPETGPKESLKFEADSPQSNATSLHLSLPNQQGPRANVHLPVLHSNKQEQCSSQVLNSKTKLKKDDSTEKAIEQNNLLPKIVDVVNNKHVT